MRKGGAHGCKIVAAVAGLRRLGPLCVDNWYQLAATRHACPSPCCECDWLFQAQAEQPSFVTSGSLAQLLARGQIVNLNVSFWGVSGQGQAACRLRGGGPERRQKAGQESRPGWESRLGKQAEKAGSGRKAGQDSRLCADCGRAVAGSARCWCTCTAPSSACCACWWSRSGLTRYRRTGSLSYPLSPRFAPFTGCSCCRAPGEASVPPPSCRRPVRALALLFVRLALTQCASKARRWPQQGCPFAAFAAAKGVSQGAWQSQRSWEVLFVRLQLENTRPPASNCSQGAVA